MWLLAGQKAPDHSTIARFRTGFLANACEGLFYQMVRRLADMGELSKETVFIDGTKLEACANKYTFIWRKSFGISKENKTSELKTIVDYLKDLCQKNDVIFVYGRGKRKTIHQRYLNVRYDEDESYSKLSGVVEMKDVTFGYSRLEEPLIRDFNLTLKTGSRVAFVGGSDCGKSTLAKLLLGLYQPWSGEILFDGKPMTQIDRSVFTGSLAVVDQDVILFEDTIANNIRMWDSSIEDFEVIMAARDAQLHEDIMQRDGGYNYKLTENGKDFSGGQRQRMEIARAVAPGPKILMFDEATSALDNITQKIVSDSLEKLKCTRIVIAHRLSTIRQCDRIIYLHKGKIVEDGTYEELIAKNGRFAELVKRQWLDV